MSSTETPDTTSLPAFLTHLEQRSPDKAEFARRLLDDDWTVEVFWGPQQMDVWQLVLAHGDWRVQFGIERGFADGVMYGRAGSAPRHTDLRWIALATFTYAARLGDGPASLDDPDRLPENLVTYGLATLEWLDKGDATAVDRVATQWHAFHDAESDLRRRTHGQPSPEDLHALRSRGVDAMRRAALDD